MLPSNSAPAMSPGSRTPWPYPPADIIAVSQLMRDLNLCIPRARYEIETVMSAGPDLLGARAQIDHWPKQLLKMGEDRHTVRVGGLWTRDPAQACGISSTPAWLQYRFSTARQVA